MSPAFLRSDAALAMTTRAVQGAAMASAGILVLLRMSATDQGFYFAFISFGLLLQLCDFGLSYASLQAASHRLATGRAADLASLTARALRINTIVTVAAIDIVVAGLALELVVAALAVNPVVARAAGHRLRGELARRRIDLVQEPSSPSPA